MLITLLAHCNEPKEVDSGDYGLHVTLNVLRKQENMIGNAKYQTELRCFLIPINSKQAGNNLETGN